MPWSLGVDAVTENLHLSSRTLCTPRMSMQFRSMCQAFGVHLWDLESSFKHMLPWQHDLLLVIH